MSGSKKVERDQTFTLQVTARYPTLNATLMLHTKDLLLKFHSFQFVFVSLSVSATIRE